jgi:hypothetical protein
MADRKRRNARPKLEPMEGRELLSGLLIALQPTNVPYLTGSEVASIASSRAQVTTSGQLTAAQVGSGSANTIAAGTGNASVGGPNMASAGGGLYNGDNNPEGINFPDSPIIGNGTPTAAELAREKFVATFSGPLTVIPGRFSDQKQIIFMRGVGGSTPNFFLHGDYSLAIVIPTGFNRNLPAGTGGTPNTPGYVPPVTGFAFLDDKNNNSGAVVGLDLVADSTSFDAKGRPTRLTFTADQNVYGGIFFVDSAVGTVHITYGKNSATAKFNGRIYTSGLTSAFENVDLYAKHSG